ncbi:MAG: ABC transporter ATP-binding protein [Clostridia bacterium]|nr:ABC transporter ATP-binding protein [Clostridia bacterium]
MAKETENRRKRFRFLAVDDDQAARTDIQYEGSAIRRILAYMKPHWKTYALCLTLMLVVTGLDLLRPILIGSEAIDKYILGPKDHYFAAGENADWRFAGIVRSTLLYIAVLVVTFIANRTQFWLMQRTGQEIIKGIRDDLFAHVEKLTMRFFDITPVGKIVTRLTNDVDAVNDVFANILVQLIRNAVKIIGYATVMLVLNARLAGYAFLLMPLVGGLTFLFRKLSRKAFQITRTRVTNLNTYLSEHLSGMRIIQIFCREKRKYEEFAQKNDDLYRAGFRELMINATFRPILYLISIIAICQVMGTGSEAVLGLEGINAISIGTLYIFIDYMNSFFQPIQEMAEQFTTLQSAIASAEKIFTLMDTEPLFDDPVEPVHLKDGVKGCIEFDHVWFAYVDEEWVLKDVSFVIEPGQKVAFVGATGAGKSSILNLIGRYYDVQKGSIRVDGVDIRELSREELRRAIGQVQQDVFIFTGDIRSNIRLRDESITDEQIVAAATEVNAARFIDRLPMGYATPAAERGATFSAGQRQLISFARTLAYDPAILILDEATANIDTETEQWIQEAVERLMRGRTTIMVAHRLSTIQHADTIMVMHHGRIRERGTHQELLEQDGIYKKLYQLQLAER